MCSAVSFPAVDGLCSLLPCSGCTLQSPSLQWMCSAVTFPAVDLLCSLLPCSGCALHSPSVQWMCSAVSFPAVDVLCSLLPCSGCALQSPSLQWMCSAVSFSAVSFSAVDGLCSSFSYIFTNEMNSHSIFQLQLLPPLQLAAMVPYCHPCSWQSWCVTATPAVGSHGALLPPLQLAGMVRYCLPPPPAASGMAITSPSAWLSWFRNPLPGRELEVYSGDKRSLTFLQRKIVMITYNNYMFILHLYERYKNVVTI